MKLGKKFSITEFASAYEKKGCNVTSTCTALGINRKTFYKWREKYSALDEALKEKEDALLDFAESKLYEHISNGDITSLIFLLKTKGKSRGYVETIQNDVTVNQFEEFMKTFRDDK
ncbi:MAG: hypothetical protein J6P44_02260 [Bacteroidales bacterium]|nr:hypothetical protein [Bacteroidales bacterium]MBQ9253258.1 hypothetical protein [Bacteroidales bacterium]